jgi:hypothetical protein
MAYMNQERKRAIAERVKPILREYGMRGSFSVDNHRGIQLTLRSGKIDFRGLAKEPATRAYWQTNTYYPGREFNGDAAEFLAKVVAAMKGDEWYDRSDIMTDYFDVAYYVSVDVGRWDREYIYQG